MKVRNLLLAGLAAVAMTACSNENDETVDNGQVQGTENALIQLGISYPVTTRATEEERNIAYKKQTKSLQLEVSYFTL